MKELETENARLKRMYADLALENRAMKDLMKKSTDAAREARGGGVSGGAARVFEWAVLSLCRVVPFGLVSNPTGLAGEGCGCDGCIEYPGRSPSPLGILEIPGPVACPGNPPEK